MIVLGLTVIDVNASIRMLSYWLLNIIFPSINAQVIVTYILTQKNALCKEAFNAFKASSFESIGNDTIGWNCLILVLHILLLLIIIIIIDTGLLKFSFSHLYEPTFDENILDNDVLAERSRILDLQTDILDKGDEHNDYLTINDLVKYYRKHKTLAVNHLTFGVKRGEAFGLLGYNGSGKTTTFRIIIGDLISTQGTAYINGQNIRHRIKAIRHLGYCPQENCSMEYLTVQDSLYL